MDPASPPTLSARALGQLLLMQSVLGHLPDEPSILSFVCHGLRDVPGVADARMAPTDNTPLLPTCVRFPLRVGNVHRGELEIQLSDPSCFAPYESYLRNFCFMLAVVLEERHQRRLNEEHNAQLERRVAERTAKLEASSEALTASRLDALKKMQDAIAARQHAEQVAIALQHEIAERKRAEEALKDSERQFRSVLESISLIGVMLDQQGRITLCNDFVLGLTGWKREEVLHRSWFDLFLPPEIRDKIQNDIFLKSITTGTIPAHFENEIITRAGERRMVAWNNTTLRDPSGAVIGVASIGEDITARKRSEEEKQRLQEQLAQAQKMESIGRLAGGVAHDFNNLLQAILGNVELALEETKAPGPTRESLIEIRSCARRSADLTRQLLAFARQQTISPRVLDLNETVETMLKMLRRLMGEDIDLAWLPAPALGPVKVDPTQIDQILANLCVNARDAIQGVGQVSIETRNVTFAEDNSSAHPEVIPGDFVMLAVSDSGSGMDKETMSHIFEPFFTTKGLGKGTGLGLATTYGIVKQNNGFIHVTSEPGQGTTFTIYLARHTAGPAEIAPPDAQEALARGTETILLAEDEPVILKTGRRILEGLGYTVLAAPTPAEAIRLARDHQGKIHLLMTDVVMPGMNGRDLARQLSSLRPDLKCLFMSGYTADVIAHHGVLDEKLHFLQKPFSMESLASRIRLALDGSQK